MRKRNVTLQLDEELVRRAKVVAAKRGTSVSSLVARELAAPVAEDERYEAAWREAAELMRTASPAADRGPGTTCTPSVSTTAAAEVTTFIDTKEEHQLSFRDALVVQACRTAGAGLLLTEDLQHRRVIDGVRIENPFREAAGLGETR